jgi:hypothetical protein
MPASHRTHQLEFTALPYAEVHATVDYNTATVVDVFVHHGTRETHEDLIDYLDAHGDRHR